MQSQNFSPRFDVYGPDQGLLASINAETDLFTAHLATLNLGQAGVYQIVPNSLGGSGDYRLKLSQAATQTLSFGQHISGTSATNPVWVFTGAAGQILHLQQTEGSYQPTILGPSGQSLSLYRGNYYGLPETGAYRLLIDSTEANYAFSLDIIQHQVLTESRISGRLEDHQVWAFTGQTGQIIRLALDGLDGLDTYLSLLDDQGTLIASNDDSDGVNALLHSVRLPQDGLYYVLPGGYSDTGSYELTLSPGEARVFPAPGFVQGNLAAGLAWVFEVQNDILLRVRIQADAPDTLAFLTLLGPEGEMLSQNQSAGQSIVPQAGAYTILPSGNQAEGGYRLYLTPTQVIDIQVNSSAISGQVDQGLGQVYRFEGQAGQTIDIEMRAITEGLDSFLNLYDAQGNLLTRDDDGAGDLNARISQFVLPATGLYFIETQALNAGSGLYSLSFRSP